MKKVLLTLLASGALSPLMADDAPVGPPEPSPQSFVNTHHELYPTVSFLRHKEENYNYTKVLGGLNYNYYRS